MTLRGKNWMEVSFIFNTMFFEVDAKDLVVGKKYAMSVYPYKYYTARFNYHSNGPSVWFYDSKMHLGIENITTHQLLLTVYNKNYSEFFDFVPQKEKIQRAMEQRALDKILKRLINDDFTW